MSIGTEEEYIREFIKRYDDGESDIEETIENIILTCHSKTFSPHPQDFSR